MASWIAVFEIHYYILQHYYIVQIISLATDVKR